VFPKKEQAITEKMERKIISKANTLTSEGTENIIVSTIAAKPLAFVINFRSLVILKILTIFTIYGTKENYDKFKLGFENTAMSNTEDDTMKKSNLFHP
jgi:hypothetical protein